MIGCASPGDVGTTDVAAATDLVEAWKLEVGPVSQRCSEVALSTRVERIGSGELAVRCERSGVQGCVVRYEPTPLALLDEEIADEGTLAHEIAHVLSRCEIGAYDSGHRNRATWRMVEELGGSP